MKTDDNAASTLTVVVCVHTTLYNHLTAVTRHVTTTARIHCYFWHSEEERTVPNVHQWHAVVRTVNDVNLMHCSCILNTSSMTYYIINSSHRVHILTALKARRVAPGRRPGTLWSAASLPGLSGK